ncbi:MAG: DUF4174 domain-containing protein [Bacteroidota bacterium]
MKLFTTTFLLIAASFMVQAQDFTDYQWESRILLLVDPIPESAAMRAQLVAFLETPEEMKERDLLLFRVTADNVLDKNGKPTGVSRHSVYKDYALSKQFQGILLIGKDGGVKLKENFFVKPSIIFSLIDGMPMRRAEMRSKKG